ncbi:hypothetical protein JB92DRAFT_3105167 [Gautieria morchelliformis]|nr:hypothetical protein JB92DRAFT_3105167 [Gautieria morchelliformis]
MWQPPPSQYPPLEAQSTNATDYPDYTRYHPEQDWVPREYYQEQFAPYDNSDGGYMDIDGPPASAGPSHLPPIQTHVLWDLVNREGASALARRPMDPSTPLHLYHPRVHPRVLPHLPHAYLSRHTEEICTQQMMLSI